MLRLNIIALLRDLVIEAPLLKRRIFILTDAMLLSF